LRQLVAPPTSVRRVWLATCKAAGILGARIHDARHTFAVAATMSGVPIVRLQKLLGHADPTMSLRYARHSPEAYLDQDATAIDAQLDGTRDREAGARAQAARMALVVA